MFPLPFATVLGLLGDTISGLLFGIVSTGLISEIAGLFACMVGAGSVFGGEGFVAFMSPSADSGSKAGVDFGIYKNN